MAFYDSYYLYLSFMIFFNLFFWGFTITPQICHHACCKQGKAAPGDPAIMGGTLHHDRVHHSRDTLDGA